jgi:chromosome segregation ATPase
MTEVTAEDLRRDLEADLKTITRPGITYEAWVALARIAWSVAIRRALAAEADAAQLRETVHALEMENHTLRQELSQTTTQAANDEADRLRSVCHLLEQENRICREDVKGIIDRECATLNAELAQLRTERDRLIRALDWAMWRQ